jgi:hypothetical protein
MRMGFDDGLRDVAAHNARPSYARKAAAAEARKIYIKSFPAAREVLHLDREYVS